MARAIDADKAIEVAQIKYNDWNLAMAAADGQREINLCFKKQELFKAVKAVLECVPTLNPQNKTPPCYQPDGDGCAYQCYDGDDEPIDKCKECPLCYSDKQRHLTPPNEPLTLEQLREMGGQPVWVKVIGKTGIRCDGWCEVEIREKDPFAYVWWPGSEVEDIAKIEDYGKTWACYAYPQAHIDREEWTAEWKDHYKSGVHTGTGAICSSCDVWNERKTHICPFCGKAMDEDGLAMLEKRMGVK